MSKQKLIERAEAMQRELDALKVEINKPEGKGRFIPEIGESYYISAYGAAYEIMNNDDRADKLFIPQGNCYRTEEEAQHALDRRITITAVNDMIDEENDGWVPDWSDFSEGKCILAYSRGKIKVDCYSQYKHPVELNYIESRESAKKIINKLTREQIKLIFGE